jgi:hypothetical protein
MKKTIVESTKHWDIVELVSEIELRILDIKNELLEYYPNAYRQHMLLISKYRGESEYIYKIKVLKIP